ncbi:cell wall elongation regulator TseB-like domain-containing protein [Levilactobacillus sp. HBUAS70063]|uniref:cell wall elongation regulator TseB-like domain-containing protein n=1 Tax=Levilactobacillus sp. HBUAS70063 TaxID=3109359 RepID=UPI00313313EC
MRQQYQRRQRPRHWVLLSVLIVILILLLSAGYVINKATKPLSQDQARAESVAKKSGHLTSTSGFYWTNLDTTYYTVAGKNKAKQAVYAIVPKSGKNVTVLKQSDGLSRNAALQKVWQHNPKKVLSAALSMFNGKPAWQISYLNKSGKLCYLTYQYSNGQVLQQISNI